MRREQNQLMNLINASSFALDDIALYLDTHPCDQEALHYYNQQKELRSQAIKEYTMQFGPIEHYNIYSQNCWAWSDSPWPWEGEC